MVAFRLRDAVSLHASGSDCAHFLGHEPHCRTSFGVREVGNDEERQNSNRGTGSGLKDEQPLPAVEIVDVAESVEHAGGDQARAGLTEYESRVKDGDSECEFFPRVPCREDKNCSRQKRGLCKTEEKANNEECGIVVGCSCAGGDDGPDERASREVDSRAHSSKQHVGRQLADHVANLRSA